MATVTAILATLFFCSNNGPISENFLCKDGSKPDKVEISILTKTDSIESIISIARNNEVLLTLLPDGTTKRDEKFSVDDAAMQFWFAIAAVYAKSCPPLAEALPAVKIEK